ncbi:ComF family protein, partial [Candidatus Desantisbacteria bacterium]|nr:ComF family protein [Candidatus Desantisbacteria bacterium]
MHIQETKKISINSDLTSKYTAFPLRGRRAGKKFLKNLLDFVFPRVCINCKTLIGKDYFGQNLCSICYSQIEEIAPPYCEICCKPFILETEYQRICSDCKKIQPFYRFLYSAAEYNNEVINKLILSFKYSGKYFLARDMAMYMLQMLEKNSGRLDLNTIDYVVPVPLYYRKKRERGYNQSELLGEYVAKFANLNFNGDILLRKRDTESQTELNFKMR